jgi:N-acetylglutamate synthase-like GNAT family acetyltransferase
MSPSKYRLRRATLDDLTQLAALWASMDLPAGKLARQITEFQVAADPEDRVLGAIGLEIAEQQGRIHSEGFTDFALADYLRPMLWERIMAVATNHGLLRLWTQETAPFWHHCGMVAGEAEALKGLPVAWRTTSLPWLTVKLRENLEAILSADQAFALFMQAEKARTAKALWYAKLFKSFSLTVALLVLALALGATLYLVWRHIHGLGQ